VELLQVSEAELRMPCHLHVNYENDNWEAQSQQAPQCAGRAIHFANRCKMPRNPSLLSLPADRETVFSNPQDFINHHTLGDQPAPKIMIVLNQVKILQDA
jgi:hypothetical protein